MCYVGSIYQTTQLHPLDPVSRPGSKISVTLGAAVEMKPRAGTWPQAWVLQGVSLLAESPTKEGPYCPRPETLAPGPSWSYGLLVSCVLMNWSLAMSFSTPDFLETVSIFSLVAPPLPRFLAEV